MGLYLNQLPQTEVARLKAELAETLIANFCYPRFFDYRMGALRTRPVDRARRQEVWHYLNAVDFNVWGRVELDSPDFQRQVERLFIHFVQRNRSFFGHQGRKRMTDVRTLINSCSATLVESLRTHLNGQATNPPFGSPHPVMSWSASNVTGQSELGWEQILSGTMLLQQQLQEARGEARPAQPASPTMPATPPAQSPLTRPAASNAIPNRRPRGGRPGSVNGGNSQESEMATWPPASARPGKSQEAASAPMPAVAREAEQAQAGMTFPTSADAAPTLPLVLGKIENMATTFQPAAPIEVSVSVPTRPRRGKQAEGSSISGTLSAPPPSNQLARQNSQPLAVPTGSRAQAPAPSIPGSREAMSRSQEQAAIMPTDEDVAIFEQMRHHLVIWLRVEALRAGLEPNAPHPFQLVDALRHQDGVDAARLQVLATLLTMCEQIISNGRATLFDYKQAMMLYLMHTRRGQ